MNISDREQLKVRISENYKNIMSAEYIEVFLDDLEPLMDKNMSFRKIIKQWLLGKNSDDDIVMVALDGEQEWSLREIATRLHERAPNIPAAALLLDFYREHPVTMSMILSIAEEECHCDERILLSDDPVCTFAYLDPETEQWFFTNEESEVSDMRKCQMWQVLVAVPELAEIVCYDYGLGTGVIFEDGQYTVYEIEEPDTDENYAEGAVNADE